MGKDVKTHSPHRPDAHPLASGVRPHSSLGLSWTFLIRVRPVGLEACPGTRWPMVIADPFFPGFSDDIVAAAFSTAVWEPSFY